MKMTEKEFLEISDKIKDNIYTDTKANRNLKIEFKDLDLRIQEILKPALDENRKLTIEEKDKLTSIILFIAYENMFDSFAKVELRPIKN